MSKIIRFGFISFILIIGFLVWQKFYPKPKTINVIDSNPIIKGFSITSPEFISGGNIPTKYTCDAQNISFPLAFHNPPAKTQSYVLIVDDIDTPQASYVHWLMWNIPVNEKQIATGEVPTGAILGKNGFGQNSYGGPCPSSGIHRYVIRLYAIDTYLELPMGSQKQSVIDAINTHVLAKTEYTGIYQR
jgi:Raf kinase inhibitor-like YbhB/YbcL family protein